MAGEKFITQIVGTLGTSQETFIVKDPNAGTSEADKYLKLNDKGNLELSNNVTGVEDDSKVNIVSKTDVQIKPGEGGTIQLDCEADGTTEGTELSLKACNGGMDKVSRVVDTKWNTTKWVFDTQKGMSGADKEDFIMQFRLDKWNEGEVGTNKGPIQVKLKGRSFDIRCHDHGGVALQPAGADSDNKENKVKFESSRKSVIGTASPEYNVAGGDGMEFGTFNNNHSSLFTGTYRFRANAPLYAACRGALETATTGKVDYPTQADDFKDILPTETDVVTWADVINVVRYLKTTEAYQTWLSNHKLTVPVAGTDGFDENNMKRPE